MKVLEEQTLTNQINKTQNKPLTNYKDESQQETKMSQKRILITGALLDF